MRRFANGATSGRASSIKIRELDGGHAIVDVRGKGAVLAFRSPSGRVIAFEGWYGFSTSTSSMLTKMGLSPVARKDDHRDYLADAYSTENPNTATVGVALDRGYMFVKQDDGTYR